MIVGCLCWYDESPKWLAAAVAGAARLCDHVVAVDGAYGLYPGGRPRSDPEQAEAILNTCYAAGIGCTLHQPAELWMGNQVEKRSYMFGLAGQMTTDEDWVFVFDADDVVTHVPADLPSRLAAADDDAAVYTLWWTEDVHGTSVEEMARLAAYPHEGANRYHRGLFRALPGLRVEGAHYHYAAERDGDTVHLRGHPDFHELADALNVTDMRVQHRHPQRTRARLDTAAAYDRLVRGHDLEFVTAEQWQSVA